MRLRHSIFLLLTFLFLLTIPTAEAGSVREQALAFAAPRFELEDLTAELQGDGRVIHVSGKIRNHSNAPVKGYVVIYYRNANNEPLHAVEVEVNQKQPFEHGEAGFFEATANIEQVSGIASVSVEFVDQPTPVKNMRPKK